MKENKPTPIPFVWDLMIEMKKGHTWLSILIKKKKLEVKKLLFIFKYFWRASFYCC